MMRELEPANLSLEFEIRRLGMTTLRGHFARFALEIERGAETPPGWSFVLRVESASVVTDAAMRDARRRAGRSLDAERYPEIVFTSTRIEPLNDIDHVLSRATGELTALGQTHEVAWELERLARVYDLERQIGVAYLGRLAIDPTRWRPDGARHLVRPRLTFTLRFAIVDAAN